MSDEPARAGRGQRRGFPPLQPALVAGGVELRRWEPTDAAALLEAGSDPTIRSWMPRMPHPYGDAEAASFLRNTDSWWDAGTRCELATVFDGEVVGLCGFTIEDGDGHVGYWVLARHRGRGTAATALRLLTSWALQHGVVDSLVCRVATQNTPSRRTAERAGYVHERFETAFDDTGGRRELAVLVARRPEVGGVTVAR